jgi:hypothetical protein
MTDRSGRLIAQDATSLQHAAAEFQHRLDAVKAGLQPDFGWYPYGTLNNFVHLRPLLEAQPLLSLSKDSRVADIGTADGDIAFFLEELGYTVDAIDYGPTNYNGLRGARLMREQLGSSVNIHEVDLDSQFVLPQARYGLIFFLGTLYHLKNPFYVLEALAQRAEYLLTSTRVARFAPNRQPIGDIPVAYLLGPDECNNDPTNFWIFTDAGLMRILDRAGWEVIASRHVGDTEASDPVQSDHDERWFAILRSRALRR